MADSKCWWEDLPHECNGLGPIGLCRNAEECRYVYRRSCSRSFPLCGSAAAYFQMKVFFYTTSLAVGGAEQQCCRTATTLKSMYGYNVEVIVTYPERSNERLSALLGEHSIPIHGCPWKSINGLLKLYRLFRSGGGDSVLFCYNTFPDFFGCVVGRLAGMKRFGKSITKSPIPRGRKPCMPY